MKRLFVFMVVALVAVVTLTWATGLSQAQDVEINRAEAAAAGSNYIPVQGRLTDASSSPLNGNYEMTFRLYGAATGGTALCSFTQTVAVADGLFTTYMYANSCPIDGRTLYLSVQVGSDPEMTPRQYIDNVPYAWSLRPGALIKDSRSGYILQAENSGSGSALSGKNISPTAGSIGIEGTSLAGPGVRGSSLADIGVVADSFSGISLKATGTGVIQSAAKSYVWISGNDVRPYRQSDSTIIDMNNTGGAHITRGADIGTKNVMLPIVVPGQLYGQNVTVSGLDIYWAGDTDFDGITAVLLRRQTGVCSTSSCYASLIHDTADYTCEDSVHPTGCTIHYNVTNNNILSNSSGILYLTIELSFSGSTTWIDIGGARLTLEHE